MRCVAVTRGAAAHGTRNATQGEDASANMFVTSDVGHGCLQ